MLNNLPVTEATIANISEVKHLRHLQLYACEVNLANLARQPFLNQLKSLTLGKVKNVKYIIHAVSKSANLNHLQLLDTEVDYDSLRELQHLPALSVRDHAVDDKFIQTVTELSQLKRIGVLGKLGPEQLKTLIACPHLIRIELAEEYYSPDLQQRLKRSSEKVVFVRSTHSDVTGGGDIFEIIGRTH
jgi:hypothetical protein